MPHLFPRQLGGEVRVRLQEKSLRQKRRQSLQPHQRRLSLQPRVQSVEAQEKAGNFAEGKVVALKGGIDCIVRKTGEIERQRGDSATVFADVA